MIVAFEKRETFELDLKDMPTAKNVQNLILRGTKADGGVFRVDIGRVCYIKREKDIKNSFHLSGKYTAGLVNRDSLSLERVRWLKLYLEFLAKKNLRNEGIRGVLYNLKHFLNYCDFEGTEPTSMEELIINYQSYQLVLRQKAHSGGYSPSTLYKLLNNARRFIQIAFNFSDKEILAYIPKHRYRTGNPVERNTSFEDFEKNVKTYILCFNQFSNAILEGKYPIHIKLLDSEKDSLYWCTHTGESLKNIPNLMDNMGNLASFPDIEEAISYYFNSKRSVKDFYDTLVYNRNRWINESICPKKVYAYNFSVYCFFRIYLAFTAANVQPSLDLKISDLDVNKIGSGSFAKAYKHRAGKDIHFTSSNTLKRLLLQYLKLRNWLNDQDCVQEKNVDDHLFVSISKHKKIIRLKQGSGWATTRESPFFDGINPISLRDLRNLAGEYVIKQSKGKLSLVAKKLNNTIATVARSYSSIDLESQAIEMNGFHEDLSLRIRQFNRDTDKVIPVNIIENFNQTGSVERIATGSCSNLCEYTPVRADGFNDNAPDPECGTFKSCLFCKFFSLHIDFEDIHKLLSLIRSIIKNIQYSQ